MNNAKERLRDLDRLKPPDVWDRATSIEPGRDTDEILGGPATSKRIIAAIVAFAVFLAAGAFAWRALRSQSSMQAASTLSAIDGTILWPERTADDLATTQAKVDAGDTSLAWRLSPKEVATRFAEDGLGWGPAGNMYGLEVDDVSGDTVTVVLSWIAVPCPTPMPGEVSSCPPPYQGETFTLEQAGITGDTGIWSITSVRASGLDIALDPGSTVAPGTVITGHVGFPDTAAAYPGFSAVASAFAGDELPSTTCGPIAAVEIQSGEISIEAPECGLDTPGYVWIATAGSPLVVDGAAVPPLYSQAEEGNPRFYGLTIVPMLVSPPTTGDSPTPSPEVSPTSDAGLTSP